MIEEIVVTPLMIKEAQRRNEKYLNTFGNVGTFRKNKVNQRMTGYLAEAAIIEKYPLLSYSDNVSVDFIYSDITLDSKAQGCNTKPLPHYHATLYEVQKNRQADYYIFSRVKNDFSIVWICGVISKQQFFNQATLQEAGTKNNNFVYDQARFEIKYHNLKDTNSIFQKPKLSDIYTLRDKLLFMGQAHLLPGLSVDKVKQICEDFDWNDMDDTELNKTVELVNSAKLQI